MEQLDELRREHAELEVKYDTVTRELTIAKSDCELVPFITCGFYSFFSVTLVNKDQLDILATLRESVNEDKAGLEAENDKFRKQNKELSEKVRMQLEQINTLLLEKVNLQSEGIGHREKLWQRERDFRYALSRCFVSLADWLKVI